MDPLSIFTYAIKIAISTVIIWASIAIVDRGSYRNSLKNALITAAILTIMGYTPFVWLFGLVIWVLILINWYSIGFFKSFLCVLVYGVLFFLLNLLLTAALLGGAFVVTKMTDTTLYAREWQRVQSKLPASVLEKLGLSRKAEINGKEISYRKNIRIYLKNGNILDARILLEGRRGILVDIADGKSEIVIRKDIIDHIDEL